MLMIANPWSSIWFDHSIAVGKLVGFELRNAITVLLVPIFFAFNVAMVVTLVAWVWRITRHSTKTPTAPVN